MSTATTWRERADRWVLPHTQPKYLDIDHPVLTDLAQATDEIERLTADRDEWKQCCEVEAGLRREFHDDAERLREALAGIKATYAEARDYKAGRSLPIIQEIDALVQAVLSKAPSASGK